MKVSFGAMSVAVTALLCAGSWPGVAHASQAVGRWYHGDWRCTIDGRPSKMRWQVRDNPTTSCNGNVCTTSAGVRTVGEFWDRNGPWVRLSIVKQSQSTLHFRHADGNLWFLQVSGSRANGWTTWNGSRFPLSCVRR
jgi:glucan-binding YG repeat protein